MTHANAGDPFASFRKEYHPPKPPRKGFVKNQDETVQMTSADGLEPWTSRVVLPTTGQTTLPTLFKAMESDKRLWVIRDEDVVHAHERCEFGKSLQTGVIKHTNLTGGAPAYCAGELLLIDDDTIVLNGCSGRYGPSSEAEMHAAAKSFRNSGYNVWSQGFDDEADRPVPFFTIDPMWVS